MPDLDIRKIKNGLPGITPVAAAQLYEACVVCLHKSEHPENVPLKLIGDRAKEYNVIWKDDFNPQMDRTYKDQEYTTEHGAVCISAMIAINETDYTIIERSRKGTGIDYWLGYETELPFQRSARLEVSGIFNGQRKGQEPEQAVEKRFRIKVNQSNQSDASRLPAYISVVEFSRPIAKFAEKKK